jgi:DNA-binding IscR family transcriptional regulator
MQTENRPSVAPAAPLAAPQARPFLGFLPMRVQDCFSVCACLASGENRDLGSIGRILEIPVRRLEFAAALLLRLGVVSSRRGRHGGYRLELDPQHTLVLDLLGKINAEPEADSLPWTEPTSPVVMRLRAQLDLALRRSLRGVTLAQFLAAPLQ